MSMFTNLFKNIFDFQGKSQRKLSAIIIPTRSRVHALQEIIQSLEKTNTSSTIYFCCDIFDKRLILYFIRLKLFYQNKYKLVVYKRFLKKIGVVGPLNYAAQKISKKYDYVFFLGDDHRPETFEWDKKIVREMKAKNKYLGYANDLLRKADLPTSIAVNSKFISIVGGFGPKSFTHLYVDNFWLEIGHKTDSIIYFPDVIVRHLHPVTGLADWDSQYRTLNSKEYYTLGALEFSRFLDSEEMISMVNEIILSIELDANNHSGR